MQNFPAFQDFLETTLIRATSAKYLEKCYPFQNQICNSCAGINGLQLQWGYAEQVGKALTFLPIHDLEDSGINILNQVRESVPCTICSPGLTTDEEVVFPLVYAKFERNVALA